MRKFWTFSILSLLTWTGSPVLADNIVSERYNATQAQVQGDQEKSLGELERALKVAKETYGENAPYLAEIYYDMGSLCLNNSKFNNAEDYLKEALRLNPNSSEANLRLAELKLLQSGSFVGSDAQRKQKAEEAIKHAGAVVAKHRNDAEAHRLLAIAYESSDDKRRAFREYSAVDKLIQLNRDIYDGKPVSTDLLIPVTTPAANATFAKPKADDSALKAQQAEAKKRAEQEKKDAAEAKKAVEQQKKETAEAKKKADADKKNAAKKKADEARKLADAKKKSEEAKKNAAAKKTPASPVESGVVESTGLKANLRSKAVLLTPVKKKPAAIESSTPAPEPREESTPEQEAPKKAAPKPKAELPTKPAVPKPGKHAAGLVPPPPPVMSPYPVMVPPQAVAPPPPKPKSQPKKVEAKEPAAAKEEKAPEKEKGGSDEDDFLLDWGNAKNKKKK